MADDLYKEFRRLAPKVAGGLARMREDAFREGAVPARYKILAALAVVTVTGCEPCIRAYTKMAHGAGASREEMVEFLGVAMTGGGCPAEQWALKAYATYKELERGEHVAEEVCCELWDVD